MADTSNRHHEWEDQWRDAFNGAEASPSPHVWKNIESELALQQTSKYRRGFLFYRATAAALLLLIAGLSWYIVAHQKDKGNSLSDADSQLNRSEQVRPKTTDANQSKDNPLSTTRGLSNKNASPKEADSRQKSPQEPLASGTSDTKDAYSVDQPKKSVSSEAPPLAYQKKEPSSTKERSARRTSERQDSTGSRSTLPTDVSSLAQATTNDAETAGSVNAETGQGHLIMQGQGSEGTRNSVASLAMIDNRGVAEPSISLPASIVETANLYRVPQVPTTYQQKQDKKMRQPAFFAGLAVAPSYFDPQFQTSAAAPANVFTLRGPSGAPGQNSDERAFNSVVPSTSSGIDDRPELSLTYGIDVGINLSDHWVLASGIDYSRFSTNAETRWAVADVATGNRYPYLVANSYQLDQTTASPAPTMTTSINNAYEFVSVPMQIGYQVAIRKLNFILSSGVAANFFLGNNISAPASPLTNTRVSAEENSPFKALYYSGVLSGGVNYHILENYSFSLTPSYAFALTELTRQESAIDSQPYSFGINVGFQYQF